jgi:hypothetical protein
MTAKDDVDVDDDVQVWLDPGGGITLKAVTADGDPVELSAAQAPARRATRRSCVTG